MKVYEALNILERAERQLNKNGCAEDIGVNGLKNYIQEKYGKEMGEEL